jgi:lactate dehydrogenase-like 2-hydroxyacid dehydrogenase
MTLLLMAARRAGQAERELRAGRWRGWRPTHLIGSALKGKRLGLVGMGRIAVATARRARHGFGMRIAYYGRHACDPALAAELEAEFFPDLHGLLAAAEFVSLHVPGGAETANLIDADALAAMKPGGYLINTARGGIVDHDALAEALRSGHLAGAGLDVYPHEPQVPAALLDLENVVLLPHLGSANAETRIAMGMKALANVEAFARGEPLPDRVA